MTRGARGARAAAGLVLLAIACDVRHSEPGAPPLGRKAVQDGLGRSVDVPVPAQRIASVGPSNTEILFAIGAGGQVVARDDFSDQPAEARSIPAVGSGTSLSLERLVASRPDLVLAAEIYAPEQVRALENALLTAFFVANPTTFEGLASNVGLLGSLTGHEAEATKLQRSIQSRVQAVAERVHNAEDRPTVFYELDATDPQQPWTAGPGGFINTLITLAGGRNVAAGDDQPFPRWSAERLLRENPQVIIVGDAKYGVTPDSVRARAGWGRIAAVRDGRVHSFDDDLVSRPGPRLVDGLEAMARLLHPEAFRG